MKTISFCIRSMLAISMLISVSCSTETVKPVASPGQQGKPAGPAKAVTISGSDREQYRTALTALNNGNSEQAAKIFTDMISSNPDLAGPHSNLALIQYKNKKYVESFKLTEKAIQLNPKQAQAYNLRGQLNITAGKVHDAKSDYLKAVELKPDYANAHYNLALVYDIYLQEIELAIKHYQRYMSLLKQPDEPTKEWISHLKGTLKDE